MRRIADLSKEIYRIKSILIYDTMFKTRFFVLVLVEFSYNLPLFKLTLTNIPESHYERPDFP